MCGKVGSAQAGPGGLQDPGLQISGGPVKSMERYFYLLENFK